MPKSSPVARTAGGRERARAGRRRCWPRAARRRASRLFSTCTAQYATTIARHGAGDRQDEALDQQLTDEPPAAGAERRADADLALARARAREEQIGDVRAGDEQHDRDRAEQHQHPRLGARADEVIAQRPHACATVLVPVGMGRLERRSDLVHLRLRLLERDARLQSRDALQVDAQVVRVPNPLSLGNDVRHPEIGRPHGADRILKSAGMMPTTS